MGKHTFGFESVKFEREKIILYIYIYIVGNWAYGGA